MARTCRQYWWNLQGHCQLNFNWDAIDHDSVVIVNVSEYAVDGPDPAHGPRFLGAAPITVENVSPHGPPFDPNHGVTMMINVEWGAPLHVVTDITVLDHKPEWIGWQGDQLAFTMQHQQQDNWCWAAAATSIAHYYDASSSLTQCAVANAQLGRADCCGSGAGGPCNVPSGLPGPIQIAGHFDHSTVGVATVADTRTEIDHGRPLGIRIGWSGGGGHFIVITGYHLSGGQFLHVDDPWYGPSDVSYSTLEFAYQGSGSWTHCAYTKP